jgi:ABC-type lipoprotein export system ATPase subunit
LAKEKTSAKGSVRTSQRRAHATPFFNGTTKENSGIKSGIFNIELPVKMMVVAGSSGCGKSTFLSALSQKLFYVAKKDSSLNISLLRNSHNRFHLNRLVAVALQPRL